MAIVQLVRHGKAAAGFGAHPDPGLDDLGRSQAAAVAAMLDQQHQIRPILLSSPLARAYETAQALAALWQADITIENRVAEIPSPTPDLEARAAWLSQAMAGNWSDLDASVQQWQQDIGGFLAGCEEDCIIFSHYVAINAAVGAATGDDRMRIFGPDNCSVTTLDNAGGKLTVVELGRIADTHIN
ncbi:MAG: histidine phosphatase family protein [Pseudomonadales bacterium]|nr:histidine phosphatase family protein [Pseudomonadales bacterium]